MTRADGGGLTSVTVRIALADGGSADVEGAGHANDAAGRAAWPRGITLRLLLRLPATLPAPDDDRDPLLVLERMLVTSTEPVVLLELVDPPGRSTAPISAQLVRGGVAGVIEATEDDLDRVVDDPRRLQAARTLLQWICDRMPSAEEVPAALPEPAKLAPHGAERRRIDLERVLGFGEEDEEAVRLPPCRTVQGIRGRHAAHGGMVLFLLFLLAAMLGVAGAFWERETSRRPKSQVAPSAATARVSVTAHPAGARTPRARREAAVRAKAASLPHARGAPRVRRVAAGRTEAALLSQAERAPAPAAIPPPAATQPNPAATPPPRKRPRSTLKMPAWTSGGEER